jgi:hypothetical protein
MLVTTTNNIPTETQNSNIIARYYVLIAAEVQSLTWSDRPTSVDRLSLFDDVYKWNETKETKSLVDRVDRIDLRLPN